MPMRIHNIILYTNDKKLKFILKLKLKLNDWLLKETSPQVANHWALF